MSYGKVILILKKLIFIFALSLNTYMFLIKIFYVELKVKIKKNKILSIAKYNYGSFVYIRKFKQNRFLLFS